MLDTMVGLFLVIDFGEIEVIEMVLCSN